MKVLRRYKGGGVLVQASGRELFGDLTPHWRPLDGRRGRRVNVLRESVAAHQAGCLCHPQYDGEENNATCDDRCEGGRYTDAKDSSGQTWHLDPLCKVRPEARA